jgi:hypothetical protein
MLCYILPRIRLARTFLLKMEMVKLSLCLTTGRIMNRGAFQKVYKL